MENALNNTNSRLSLNTLKLIEFTNKEHQVLNEILPSIQLVSKSAGVKTGKFEFALNGDLEKYNEFYVALYKNLDPNVIDLVGEESDLPADPDDQVLIHAQRADYRTVYAAEEQGEKRDASDHDEVSGKAGRQELEFCHPSPPVRTYSHKQQGDACQKSARDGYTYAAQGICPFIHIQSRIMIAFDL